MVKKIATIIILFFFGNSFSQDINLELIDLDKSSDSNPREFVVINNVFYFISNGLDLGYELWRTDGTEIGTYIVKDINPGINGAFQVDISANLTNINGVLYFSANDGVNGYELWKSDGTESGTVLVKNIANSSSNSSPNSFTLLNSDIIFVCDDGINGKELWKTDGTEVGTILLKDINSGSDGSLPKYLINFNNKVYFEAFDAVNGTELWMTDGTLSNTVLQNDLYPGAISGLNNLTNMLVFNNELYFRGRNIDSGFELFKTNGNSGNVSLVINLDGSFANGFIGKFLAANSTMIFFDGRFSSQGAELWKSNGTLSGTNIVKDINPGFEDGLELQTEYSFIGETLYFTGRNSFGTELWKSDGTLAGTLLVKDIMPGSNSSAILYMSTINGQLYFSARQELVENKNYLWTSDGTTTGTYLIKDVNLRGMSGYAGNKIFECNNVIFFAGVTNVNGWELWKTDGTNVGTNLFLDLNYTASSFPRKLIQVQNKLFYSAVSGSSNGHQLFVTTIDSNVSGLVESIPNSGSNGSLYDNNTFSKFVKLGDQIIFLAATTTQGFELWKSDGVNVSLVKDINPGGNGISENFGNDFAILNDILYFTANDGNAGFELWRTDGTEVGTYILKDFNVGSASSNIKEFCVFNNKVYFVVNLNQIWTTDGTTSGTQLFISLNNVSGLKANSNKLFFFDRISSTSYVNQLWSTDGISSNSTIIWSEGGIFQRKSIIFEDMLYFVGIETGGYTIFKSDGTISGTIKLKDGLLLNNVKHLIVCGNQLYITNNYLSILHEKFNELWQTDGTAIGTIMIDTAQSTNWIGNIECFQNNLFYFYDSYPFFGVSYFNVDYGQYKVLKKTNGNLITTHNLIVSDSQQFINNYGAHDMFATDSKLYFLANNGYSGYELFGSNLDTLLSIDDTSNQINFDEKVFLYPNPVNSTVTLKSNHSIDKIIILDISGKKVLNFSTNSNQETIDVGELNSGIYFVKMYTKNGVYLNKMIKN